MHITAYEKNYICMWNMQTDTVTFYKALYNTSTLLQIYQTVRHIKNRDKE